MLFVTKLSLFIHCLILIWLCFLKYFGAIEEDKFNFLKAISINEERNVYRTFSVPHKRNHMLTCSAKCVTHKDCVGIDICHGRICRLWNLTFSFSFSSKNLSEFCQRSIKVIAIHQYLKRILLLRMICLDFVNSGFLSNVSYLRFLRCVFYIHYITCCYISYTIKHLNIIK